MYQRGVVKSQPHLLQPRRLLVHHLTTVQHLRRELDTYLQAQRVLGELDRAIQQAQQLLQQQPPANAVLVTIQARQLTDTFQQGLQVWGQLAAAQEGMPPPPQPRQPMPLYIRLFLWLLAANFAIGYALFLLRLHGFCQY